MPIHRVKFEGYKNEISCAVFGSGDIGVGYSYNTDPCEYVSVSLTDGNDQYIGDTRLLDHDRYKNRLKIELRFDKYESIDVLIRSLQDARNELIKNQCIT